MIFCYFQENRSQSNDFYNWIQTFVLKVKFMSTQTNVKIELVTIELELSASEVNVIIQWHDNRQPIIAKPRAVGGVFKHARCSDLALV